MLISLMLMVMKMVTFLSYADYTDISNADDDVRIPL